VELERFFCEISDGDADADAVTALDVLVGRELHPANHVSNLEVALPHARLAANQRLEVLHRDELATDLHEIGLWVAADVVEDAHYVSIYYNGRGYKPGRGIMGNAGFWAFGRGWGKRNDIVYYG
jgi:hypothetical protein